MKYGLGYKTRTEHYGLGIKHLGTGQKLEGGRAGAFLFWPTSFGETLPIPGAEKMLTPQNSLHNLSRRPPPPTPPPIFLVMKI